MLGLFSDKLSYLDGSTNHAQKVLSFININLAIREHTRWPIDVIERERKFHCRRRLNAEIIKSHYLIKSARFSSGQQFGPRS